MILLCSRSCTAGRLSLRPFWPLSLVVFPSLPLFFPRSILAFLYIYFLSFLSLFDILSGFVANEINLVNFPSRRDVELVAVSPPCPSCCPLSFSIIDFYLFIVY